jgi:hypothetical protein
LLVSKHKLRLCVYCPGRSGVFCLQNRISAEYAAQLFFLIHDLFL